jgi:hypothetical protein
MIYTVIVSRTMALRTPPLFRSGFTPCFFERLPEAIRGNAHVFSYISAEASSVDELEAEGETVV